MIYLNSLLLCVDNLSIGKAWVLKSHIITAFDFLLKEIADDVFFSLENENEVLKMQMMLVFSLGALWI